MKINDNINNVFDSLLMTNYFYWFHSDFQYRTGKAKFHMEESTKRELYALQLECVYPTLGGVTVSLLELTNFVNTLN